MDDLGYKSDPNKCWYINDKDHYDLLAAIFNGSDLN